MIDFGFVDGSIETALKTIYADLAAYCKRERLQLHMVTLTRIGLGWTNSWSYPAASLGLITQSFFHLPFPFYTRGWRLVVAVFASVRSWFKGQDTVSLLAFLEWKYTTLVAVHLEHEHVAHATDMLTVIRGANAFMRCMYRAGLWLLPEERDLIILNMSVVLQGFSSLADYAFTTLSLPRWKFQPKFHLLAEVRYSLMQNRINGVSSINPVAFGTQMDEDFVGRISTFSRSVNSRTMHLKTIERYLIALESGW